MANRKKCEPNIAEIRRLGRELGMSRGRITRNVGIDTVCNMKRFQLVILRAEESETVMRQREFAQLLFTKSQT